MDKKLVFTIIADIGIAVSFLRKALWFLCKKCWANELSQKLKQDKTVLAIKARDGKMSIDEMDWWNISHQQMVCIWFNDEYPYHLIPASKCNFRMHNIGRSPVAIMVK